MKSRRRLYPSNQGINTMKSLALKLICLAVAASALSGCIMYVSPDDEHHHWHHDSSSHPDEKPADTMSSSSSN